MENKNQPTRGEQSGVTNDAIDFMPASQANAGERRDSLSTSKLSTNTLEYQMQMNSNPRQPRGEPQLVGLTRLRYDPSKLRTETELNEPNQNYINQMREHSIKLSQQCTLMKVRIQLPQRMLLEQLNLILDHSSKKQSDFSKHFQLVCVLGCQEELTLKSAHSECVTRNGKIEYNIVGATNSLELVFAKDMNKQQASNVSLDQVQIKVGSGQRLINEDDDQRILSSLPGAEQQSDPNFATLLKSIEVVGFNMSAVPAITNLTYFMNQQFFLQNKGKANESNELDIMTCQLLITTKRATQAVEMYRRMQIRTLSQKITSTRQKHAQIVECAVFELLVADALSPNMQLQDKTMSIMRLCTFLRGEEPGDIRMRFPPQVTVSVIDAFSSMLAALPDCLRFTLACLTHRYEIVRISALKMLKYILETLGCSLDYGMVFILKAMLTCYPDNNNANTQYDECGFNLRPILETDTSILEFLFRHRPLDKTQTTVECTPTMAIEEPQSGTKRAMMNIYNNVLDTFISVLSSVSSHILHSIFYEVIEPAMVLDSGCPTEVKVFSCKIADKIFTICQGDLILTPRLLDSMLTLTSTSKQAPTDSVESQAQTQVKNLWQSIRQKVLPNYSQKGFQNLVSWFLQQLTDFKTQSDCDDRVRQLAELITIVAIGRSKNEEEANQLIKLPSADQFGGGPSSELYLVLAPLVYWMEYAVEREERFSLFLQIYQTIKDVISGLPKGQANLDMVSVLMPSLQRASDFMAGNSPSLSMLKFLDLVLNDMARVFQKSQRVPLQTETQVFFCQMLSNFVAYLPYSMYEESLFIFELLLQLCQDVIPERVICACIIGLIDKYTMKSKQLKSTVGNFTKFLLQSITRSQLKNQSSPTSQRTEGGEEVLSDGSHSLMRSNYFEMMADFCFFSNPLCGGQQRQVQCEIVSKQLEFRSKLDIHELNVQKLQFFIDSLSQLSEQHITIFTNLIIYPSFRSCLLSLIDNGESQIRLKAHEVMEQLTQYYVQHCPSKTVYEFTNGTNQNEMMDAEFISHERLYISQMVIQVARVSLEKASDCYLQFNSLILLDYLFQNLLPVPTFQNEQMKSKKQKAQSDTEPDNHLDEITMDVEILSVSDSTPELDVMDPAYLRMRMKLVFSLWPYIQSALNSPWSNIRSICYGLICSMLKVDVNDYPKDEPEKLVQQHLSYDESEHLYATQTGLASIVLPMLNSLLSSRESESKAGGLNILGSFCGLSYNFDGVKINKHLGYFQRNSKFVSYQVWQLVHSLQDDWDITIREASVVLVQLCAPRNCILYFQNLKENKERLKLQHMASMKNVSDAYSKTANHKGHDITQHGVSSSYAARAVQYFPSQNDCRVILEATSADTSMQSNRNQEFTLKEFMYSRQLTFPPEILSSSQIMLMSDELSTLIHRFNPTYEDKRLTKGAQPMSRRRQMEIELGMVSKNKDETREADSGFFVDQYTDDQIQEIISIFRNDFKPPKNLWIEKQPNQYGTQNYGHHGQPPQSSSPDFYQDIYSDAIEQLNQHQMMMQQKQQDEVQQQINSGHNTSQSSLSSQDSTQGNNEPKLLIDSSLARHGESSTPSPELQHEEPKKKLSPKNPKPIQTSSILPNSNLPGGQWPTSPVLVSSASSSDKSKAVAHHQTSSFAMPQAAEEVKPESPLKPEEKAEHRRDSAEEAQKRENFKAKTQAPDKTNHSSAPEFTNLVNVKNNSPKQYNSFTNEVVGGKYSSSGGNANSGGEQRMSRKTAQNFLSSLNSGVISNHLSQQQMAQADSKSSLLNLNLVPPKKINIKHSQLPLEKTYVSTKNRSKKRNNASSSPEEHRNKKSSKLGKKKDKSVTHCGTTAKQTSNLNDLNYFIKAIEKDLIKNMNTDQTGSYPVTPNSIRRRVEEQMKALGLDPKSHQRADETRKSADKLAKLKILNLGQIVKQDESASSGNHPTTKHKHQQVSPNKILFSGNDSDSEFCKTQRLEKKSNLLPSEKIRALRDKSESLERDCADRQSSGRGASNASASHSYQYPLLNQPAILTDREGRTAHHHFQDLGKHSNTTRYDQTQPLTFKKGNSKSQGKSGYGSFATKGGHSNVLSPNLRQGRENQQSGGSVQNKLNSSSNQISLSKNSQLRKAKVCFTKSGGLQEASTASGDIKVSRQPQTTRHNVQEQGDKKQLSPDMNNGKPPLKRRKSGGHSHSNSNGGQQQKPGLTLQQPNYF